MIEGRFREPANRRRGFQSRPRGLRCGASVRDLHRRPTEGGGTAVILLHVLQGPTGNRSCVGKFPLRDGPLYEGATPGGDEGLGTTDSKRPLFLLKGSSPSVFAAAVRGEGSRLTIGRGTDLVPPPSPSAAPEPLNEGGWGFDPPRRCAFSGLGIHRRRAEERFVALLPGKALDEAEFARPDEPFATRSLLTIGVSGVGAFAQAETQRATHRTSELYPLDHVPRWSGG